MYAASWLPLVLKRVRGLGLGATDCPCMAGVQVGFGLLEWAESWESVRMVRTGEQEAARVLFTGNVAPPSCPVSGPPS